jgi:hypothetical protein
MNRPSRESLKCELEPLPAFEAVHRAIEISVIVEQRADLTYVDGVTLP